MIVTQPQSMFVNAGSYPSLLVQVSGTYPMAFQWFKDSQPLTNGTAVSGAQTNTLSVNYAQKVDEGPYRVVVTNNFGAVTSSVAILQVRDPAISGQPAHRYVNPGNGASFAAAAAGTAPFTYQWRFKGVSIPGATNSYSPTFFGALSNAGPYDVVARNAYGSVTSVTAVLTVNTATLDPMIADANGTVHAIAVQGNGGLVLGGSFTSLGVYARSRIGRLLPGGLVDTQFNPTANADVYCLLAQPDGKILVGGAFTTLGGKTCKYLGRLHPDGTLDTNFTVVAKGAIYCLAWQPDGRILAGGTSTLVRFDQAGTVDSAFNPALTGTIYSMAAGLDSRITVGGSFFNIAGGGRQNLARLNSNGTLYTSFNSPVIGTVYAMARQIDGSLLLGGAFSSVAQQPRANLARLEPEGILSPDFNPGASNAVYSFALQTDGKIIVGGSFQTLGGPQRNYVARFDQAGEMDPTFNPAANGTVYALALQADGDLNLGGQFSSLAGGSRDGFGRLNPVGDATQELFSTGRLGLWFRGDALPEVEDVVFEVFEPGSGWVALGAGERVPAGWLVSALSDPNLTMRARGRSIGGRGSGSASIIEFARGPVVILTQPAGQSITGTSSQALSVEVSGTGPFQYQWYRNGVALGDGTAATYPFATIGTYLVVVCNAFGCVQSEATTIWRLNTVESATRPNPNSTVYALALQADGKILLGGSFTTVVNYPVSGTNMPRRGLARLLADGSVDDTFNPDVAGSVFCLAVLPDTRIVVGGNFTNVAGQVRYGLARLNQDGSLDPDFIVNISGPIDASVLCLAPEANGGLLVGGQFLTVAGQSRYDIARVTANGIVDAAFVPSVNLHPLRGVNSILPLADGTILLGGQFASNPNPNSYCAYRWLQQNGASAGTGYVGPNLSSSAVYAALAQADGKVVLGGSSFYVDLQGPRNIARLNPDRSPDSSFTAYANGPVLCLAAQADGAVLVGGAFTTLNGSTRNCLGRFTPGGLLDNNFNPGASTWVDAMAVQLDGRVVIGGQFTNVSTSTRNNLARLPAYAASADDWSFSDSTLTWLRNGPQAELDQAVLESSSDGVSWQPLTQAARIPGGWQMTGVSLPFISYARVRGTVVSSGVDLGQTATLLTGPFISAQPSSRTNALGAIAGFHVGVQGPGPYGYQWYRNGIPLQDGGDVTGAHGPLLAFRVGSLDAGQYQVIVSNLFGSVASEVATLSWIDLATPPLILTGEPGFGLQTNAFSFRYQALPGQTCVVEYSPELKFWYRLKTNVVNSYNPVTFTDSNASSAKKFYRVRLQ